MCSSIFYKVFIRRHMYIKAMPFFTADPPCEESTPIIIIIIIIILSIADREPVETSWNVDHEGHCVIECIQEGCNCTGSQ